MKPTNYEATGAQLKWIAIITMLIDHIAVAVIDPYIAINFDSPYVGLLDTIYPILRGIGRVAFPIFIFLMVEGFYYTHDRRKYFLRMLMFSAISEIPFDLAFNQPVYPERADNIRFLEFASQNVFFTLTLGFLTIWLCESILNFCDEKILERMDYNQTTIPFYGLKMIGVTVVIVGLCVIAETLSTDYSSIGVLAIFACYLAKKLNAPYFVMMAAAALVLIVLGYGEVPAALAVIPAFFYRGKKGKNINKWFFYLFYPGHLAVLWAVRFFWIH